MQRLKQLNEEVERKLASPPSRIHGSAPTYDHQLTALTSKAGSIAPSMMESMGDRDWTAQLVPAAPRKLGATSDPFAAPTESAGPVYQREGAQPVLVPAVVASSSALGPALGEPASTMHNRAAELHATGKGYDQLYPMRPDPTRSNSNFVHAAQQSSQYPAVEPVNMPQHMSMYIPETSVDSEDSPLRRSDAGWGPTHGGARSHSAQPRIVVPAPDASKREEGGNNFQVRSKFKPQ